MKPDWVTVLIAAGLIVAVALWIRFRIRLHRARIWPECNGLGSAAALTRYSMLMAVSSSLRPGADLPWKVQLERAASYPQYRPQYRGGAQSIYGAKTTVVELQQKSRIAIYGRAEQCPSFFLGHIPLRFTIRDLTASYPAGAQNHRGYFVQSFANSKPAISTLTMQAAVLKMSLSPTLLQCGSAPRHPCRCRTNINDHR